MIIVGLDCATKPKDIGLARAVLGETLHVEEARVARSAADVVDTIVAWLGGAMDGLLAIDAPLGWPAPLADTLRTHHAGAPVAPEANTMFRRHTDRVIHQRVKKLPLDVGADRIARTAHAALQILDDVRAHFDVAMGWSPGEVRGRQVIEVYPAATLKTRGVRSSGYKRPEHTAERTEILDALGCQLDAKTRERAIATDHVLDAIVCTLAGADFAAGRAVPPDDLLLARREGWIWSR